MLKNKLGSFLVLAALMAPAANSAQGAGTELVFVGSGDKNISAFRMDLASGAMTSLGDAAQIPAPSFLALSPNHHFLYAVSEGQGAGNSSVSAFDIDVATGTLTLLNQQLTGGSGPCFVAIDPKGKDALVANYNSGSVAVFPITRHGDLGAMSSFIQDQGSGPNPQRQEGPHAHCIVAGPHDRFAFACDLGLDKIMIFKFNPEKGSLAPNDPPFAAMKGGVGPRHIVFHPNGRFAFVTTELASTLVVFSVDGRKGTLKEIQTESLLPSDFHGTSYAAEVAVHPSGKFVYASNRGDNSIVVFHCDPATGKLTWVERDSSGGDWPRHFEIDPSGKFLLAANQKSNTVVVFRIDGRTGRLSPTGNVVETDMPECVQSMAQ